MERKTDTEKKKEFLNSYQEEKRAVARLEEQLAELTLNALHPSMGIGGGQGRTNTAHDLSDYIAEYDTLMSQVIKAKHKRIKAYQKVQESIEAMENEREKELLTYRYLRGMKWEAIAIAMNYSWRKIHYIHRDALQHFKICA